MKILQEDGGFTPEEKNNYKSLVFRNCISEMKVLVQQTSKLNIPYSTPEIAVCGIDTQKVTDQFRNRQPGWTKYPQMAAFGAQMSSM